MGFLIGRVVERGDVFGGERAQADVLAVLSMEMNKEPQRAYVALVGQPSYPRGETKRGSTRWRTGHPAGSRQS